MCGINSLKYLITCGIMLQDWGFFIGKEDFTIRKEAVI